MQSSSEKNCSFDPVIMEQQISNTEDSTVIVVDKAKLHEIIKNGSLEFDEWTSLISEIEKCYPDSIEDICLVYDSFLSEFPLCSGYWRKYVNHNIRLSTLDKVVEIFERAVRLATYSVDLWVDYCNFGTMSFEDPSDVRRLFKQALSFVGKDYLSYALWDRYIEFEFSLKNWSSLSHIYIQTLRFPTKKLHHYYDSFKKLVEIWEAEMEFHGNSSLTELVEPLPDSKASIHYNQNDIVYIIEDLLNACTGSARSKALQTYKSIGESFFQEASKLNEKISCFESCIRRPYFHVKPLDTSQLENWHQYLDFAELHGDFDWAVKLYERCLIPCVNYPEFWMRYVEFMESKGGREIANLALERATQIFLKRVSVIHMFNARFKEHIGDAANARASFFQCSTEADSEFVENIIMRSNMERRLGNFTAASTTYKEAIDMAAKMEKWHILPILYIQFSQLKYMTTDSEDDVRDILIDGIKQLPCCKLLIEELVKFAITHGGSRHINVIDTIVADAVSPGIGLSQGLNAKDGEEISRLYIEFVDLCGTLHDVRKAWNRHIKLFPPSVRTNLFRPSMRTKQWKIDMKAEETLISPPHQPSGDSSLPCLIQPALEEKKLSSPEINDSQAAYPATVHFSDQKLQNQVMVQESPLVENQNELSDQEKVDMLQSGESDNIHRVSLRVSDPSRDVTEPNISLDIESQVANGTEHDTALLELSKECDVQKEFDHVSECDLKPSLERLSLDPQHSKSPGPISPTSDDSVAPQNTSLSDGGLLKSEPAHGYSISNENMRESCQNADVESNISSTVSIQATTSSQTNRWHVSPSSSACNQDIMAQAFPQQPQLGNNGKNRHHRNNSDRFWRDAKFGFRGHSHRIHHKQQQSSPRRSHQGAEKGSQMPMNQDYRSHRHRRSSQNQEIWQEGQVQSQYPTPTVHTDLTAPQAWPTHNLQQQNLSPAGQPPQLVQPAFYAQPQMSQNSVRSNEQHGNVQNNQAYDQIWQHYYYQQQQQQLLWQQQQLHLQPQQQEFLQQQYQQQLLQMQYLQQQQGQQLQLQQQQQQQLPYQQQGQLQPQQLPQPQSYQQPHLVHMQQQQQLGVLQPLHQQSQLQLQQQQYYHQQQTPSTEQHSYEKEQGEAKHQINIPQD